MYSEGQTGKVGIVCAGDDAAMRITLAMQSFEVPPVMCQRHPPKCQGPIQNLVIVGARAAIFLNRKYIVA